MWWKALLVIAILWLLGQFCGVKVGGFLNIIFAAVIVMLLVQVFKKQGDS